MVKKILFISLALFGLLFSTMAGECFADASAQFQQAETYRKNKQYEQAEAIYQQILTDFPDSNDALEAQKQLTILYIKQDNQPRADAAFQQLLAGFSQHKDIAKAVNKVADHYGWSNKYEKARQLYQYVVDNFPQADYAVWSQKSLAASSMRLGDETNADAAIENLLTNFSQHKQLPNAVNMLADDCSMLKRYEKALLLYRYIAENCPESELAIWAQRGVAIINIKLRDDDAARDAVEKLLTDFSEHKQIAKAVNKVADHYRSSKKYEEARRLYQYVVDNCPQSEYAIWSQKSLAASNMRLGDDSNADAAIEKLLASYSQHKQKADVVNMLADECSTLKRYEKARRLYQYVVENYPDEEFAIWAQQGVAISNIKLRNDDAAKDAVEKLLTDFSEHKQIAKAVNKAADHYRWSNKFEEARLLYQYVVDNCPQSEYAIWSQKSLATSIMRLGDDPNADAAIEKLLTNFSQHKQLSNAVKMLADEYSMLKRYDKARELYQYVIDNRPDEESAMQSEMEMAKTNVLSLIESGDDPNAQAALDILIADFNEHPDLPTAVFSVAEQCFYKYNYQWAIELWELILSEHPQSSLNSEIPYLLATCYKQLKDYSRAIEYYTKVVEQYPDSRYGWRAPYRLGVLYKQLGDYEQAVYWFGQQRKLYSNESTSQCALFWQGNIYLFNMKDYQKAIEKFQEYIELYPENEEAPEVWYDLVMAYEKMGDKTQAIALLQEALLLYPDNIYTKHMTDKLSELKEGVKQ